MRPSIHGRSIFAHCRSEPAVSNSVGLPFGGDDRVADVDVVFPVALVGSRGVADVGAGEQDERAEVVLLHLGLQLDQPLLAQPIEVHAVLPVGGRLAVQATRIVFVRLAEPAQIHPVALRRVDFTHELLLPPGEKLRARTSPPAQKTCKRQKPTIHRERGRPKGRPLRCGVRRCGGAAVRWCECVRFTSSRPGPLRCIQGQTGRSPRGRLRRPARGGRS